MSKPVYGDEIVYQNCKSHVIINNKQYSYFILLANTPIKIGHVVVGVLSSVFLLDNNWMDVCFALYLY